MEIYYCKDIDHRVGCCRPLHANMSLAGWYPSKSCPTAQKTDCTLLAKAHSKFSFQLCVCAQLAQLVLASQSSHNLVHAKSLTKLDFTKSATNLQPQKYLFRSLSLPHPSKTLFLWRDIYSEQYSTHSSSPLHSTPSVCNTLCL
jgi:hypothetical protein